MAGGYQRTDTAHAEGAHLSTSVPRLMYLDIQLMIPVLAVTTGQAWRAYQTCLGMCCAPTSGATTPDCPNRPVVKFRIGNEPSSFLLGYRS